MLLCYSHITPAHESLRRPCLGELPAYLIDSFSARTSIVTMVIWLILWYLARAQVLPRFFGWRRQTKHVPQIQAVSSANIAVVPVESMPSTVPQLVNQSKVQQFPLVDLPEDVLARIMTMMTPHQLRELCITCKSIYKTSRPVLRATSLSYLTPAEMVMFDRVDLLDLLFETELNGVELLATDYCSYFSYAKRKYNNLLKVDLYNAPLLYVAVASNAVRCARWLLGKTTSIWTEENHKPNGSPLQPSLDDDPFQSSACSHVSSEELDHSADICENELQNGHHHDSASRSQVSQVLSKELNTKPTRCMRTDAMISAKLNDIYSSWPLLDKAVQTESLDMVNELLDWGFSPNQEDANSTTPLFRAVEHGYTEIAQALVDRGAMVDASDVRGQTPLHRACAKGQLECVQLLIENGANSFNSADHDLCFPIHYACMFAGNADLVKLLVSHSGLDPMVRDRHNWTPLIYAFMARDVPTCKVMMDAHCHITQSGIKPIRESLKGVAKDSELIHLYETACETAVF